MQEKNHTKKFGYWLKTSITARLIMVGVLSLLLMVPLTLIESLISERSFRQQEVVNEINQKWGNEVLIYGPILKIPYRTYKEKTFTNKDTQKIYTETVEELKFAYFFPEKLDINSQVNPEKKNYGIYETAVYKSEINISGKFAKPDFSEIDIKENQILWDKARVILQTSNLKGVNDKVYVRLNNTDYAFSSKYNGSKSYSLEEVLMHTLESRYLTIPKLSDANTMQFDLKLDIKGSKQIQFIPIGQETNVQISSNWKTANFFGEFLPYNGDKINDSGFNSKWKILDINRPFSQQHFNYLPNLSDFAFGVNFIIPVDQYQKSERSVKYGFLVISLTFLIFFLIQTMSKIDIHPFQYLMIGIALTMFYSLLISISEHSDFLNAYLIAGISVIILITLYSKSILKVVKFPLFIGVSLTVLYSFIYIIIQLESYALLVGSIGLFLILATVMYVSRKIDWSNG
tara:strand:- start:438473 stop:439846 length:1374 start_codon:yes stop_codon:yes gene_type:complete